MVTNNSSWSQDFADVKQAIGAHAHTVADALVADVIPGDPAAMFALAEHLTSLARGFERAGSGFSAIDDGGWTGAAADGFRAYLNTYAPQWEDAAAVFGSAGAQVQRYAEVLREAKAAGEQAKQQIERADEATTAALARHAAAEEEHYQRVTIANQGGPPPGPGPGPFADPGKSARDAANNAIEAAKVRVRDAGDAAADALEAARKRAPAEPGLMAQFGANAADALDQFGRGAASLGRGIAEGAAAGVQWVRATAPIDPARPGQVLVTFPTVAAGLYDSVTTNGVYGTVKSMVDLDGWNKDPLHKFGTFVPTLAGGAGIAGVSSRVGSMGRQVGREAADLAKAPDAGDVGPPPRAAEPDAPATPEPPSEPAVQKPPSESDTWNPPPVEKLSPEDQAWAKGILDEQARADRAEIDRLRDRFDPARKVG